MHLEDEFGDVIAKARLGNGLSAAQIAAIAGLEEPRLAEIEHYRLNPSEDVVRQLAEALHLDPHKLMESASGTWTPQERDLCGGAVCVRQIRVPFGPYSENAYIAGCQKSRMALIVDPGGAVEDITRLLHREKLTPELILITHPHADHIGGLHELMGCFPNVTVVGAATDHAAIMHGMDGRWQEAQDEAEFVMGRITVKAMSTPGHTPGAICYALSGACFVGDSLFAGSIGRPESSLVYAKMLSSIRDKVLSLPRDTILLPGHGPATTVAEELDHNPFF